MIRARSMSSDRSLPGLGAQLRASAHEPEDHAAAELRARLRNKMFGVGVPVAPPPPELPPDVHVEPRAERVGLAMPLLVWAVIGEFPGEWTLAGGAVVLGALLSHSLWRLRRFPPTAPA